MRRFVTLTLFAALLTTAPAPVIAQDAAATQEDEGEICVGTARIWVGTAADRRTIETRPVPDSFRDAYFGTGCERFSLIVDSLTDWHLKHGTAQSTLAAIDFFEADFQKRPGSKDWLTALPVTWDAADYRLRYFMDDGPLTKSDMAQFKTVQTWQKLPEIRAINTVADQFQTVNFIANEYARAAEYFGDAALLKKARLYHDQVTAAQAFVATRTLNDGAKNGPMDGADQGEVSDLFLWRFDISYHGDRQSPHSRGLSLAVTDAFIRRDAGSILAAHAALNDAYYPDYWEFRTAVTHIGWDEAWERREDGWQQNAYRARADDNFFIPDAVQFFVQRARLLLLAEEEGVALPPSGTPTLDMANKRGAIFEVGITLQMLMLRDRRDNYGLQANDYSDQFIGLALYMAETDLAKGVAQCTKPDGDLDRTNRLHYALDQLINLAKLTDRLEQARYYRRIAKSYRAGYQTYVQCDPNAGDSDDLTARDRLFAADLNALDLNEMAP
jgi:hypothetical protein